MLVSLGLFDGFFLFIYIKCNRIIRGCQWLLLSDHIRPPPLLSSMFSCSFLSIKLYPVLCQACLLWKRRYMCVCEWVYMCVCVYFKYYYYYQHAIHLKAPSKLEPSRGAVGNDLPTRQWLVRRLAHKAASFGGLFACLVAFLIFGAGSLSHVVRNAANCSF